MNAESICAGLIFAELVFANFFKSAKISAAKCIQNQPFAKIGSQKIFSKNIFFSKLNMQVKFANP